MHLFRNIDHRRLQNVMYSVHQCTLELYFTFVRSQQAFFSFMVFRDFIAHPEHWLINKTVDQSCVLLTRVLVIWHVFNTVLIKIHKSSQDSTL